MLYFLWILPYQTAWLVFVAYMEAYGNQEGHGMVPCMESRGN